MDKLKSNSYRQRSFSNQGTQENRFTSQGTIQTENNSIQQQQFQQQKQQYSQKQVQQYPSSDSIQQQTIFQENYQQEYKNQLKPLNQVDQNNSINILQNYRVDCQTNQLKKSFQQNNISDSFQSSIPFYPTNNSQLQNQFQSIQFCKNFVEFLKYEQSQQWLQVSKSFEELQQMVQMRLQHNLIYDKVQKIFESITIKNEFIPKKFDILISCLTQEFQNLRDLYGEIQEIINNQNGNELLIDEIYIKWNKQIDIACSQYYKIFSRHIQSYQIQNNLLQRNHIFSYNQQPSLSSSKQQRSASKGSNNSFINQTFQNKENIQIGFNLQEYQKEQREKIIDKYSNENTLNLKIQQLDKQIKQLQSLIQAKTKEFDICKSEKNRANLKIEELENKVQDLEKNITFSDPNRFNSLRTGESEYLIRRHEVEKNELKRIIEIKNQEIKSYRIELEGILGEIDLTQRNQTENNN